jgi:ABC-type glycerol-3-phosphate transport system substrate-binding protein
MNFFQTVLIIFFIILLVLGVLVFAGILPGFRSGTAGDAGRVVVWGTLPKNNKLDLLITKINNENRSSFSISYVEKRPDVYEKELVETLAGGRGPDLFLIDQSMIVKHKDKIALMPYAKISVRDYRNTYVDEANLFLAKDGIYAMPIVVDPMVMYYNRSILASAGVPDVPHLWSQFVSPDKNMTVVDPHGNILQSSVALGTYDNINHAKDILATLLLQAGNPIVEGDARSEALTVGINKQYDYAQAPAGAVVNFYTQFANPTLLTYSWNSAMPNSRDAFTAGILATYFGFASEMSDIQKKNPHLDFDVTYMPQRDNLTRITFGNVYGLAVSSRSPRLAAAGAAAIALSGKYNMELVDAIGLPSARRDVLAKGSTDPFQVVFNKAAVSAKGWLDPDRVATDTIFRDMIKSINSGKNEVMDAVDQAGDELGVLLDKYYNKVNAGKDNTINTSVTR